jgi:hypothetical protein
LRKLIAGAVVALSIGGGAATIVPATAAAASVARGTVTCRDAGNVEGVWINAGGNSGWANLSAASGAAKKVSFSRPIGSTGLWSVTFGCGGSPARWATVEGPSQQVTAYPGWAFTGLYGQALLTSPVL